MFRIKVLALEKMMMFDAKSTIKKVLLTFLFIIFGSTVWAQLRIGPKAGFQMTNVIYHDKDYTEEHTTFFKPGFNAGLVLNYKVSQAFSMHTELFYSRKGKIEKRASYDVKNIVNYQYLDLPLMLRISHHKKAKKQHIEYYLNIGPSFGYWLGGKGKLRSDELPEYIDTNLLQYKIDFKESAHYENLYVSAPNRLQIELNLGGGVIFDMARGQSLMVDLRYSFGIGQTFLGEKEGGSFGLTDYSDNLEGVNHVISLSAAYLFELDIRRMLKKGKMR